MLDLWYATDYPYAGGWLAAAVGAAQLSMLAGGAG